MAHSIYCASCRKCHMDYDYHDSDYNYQNSDYNYRDSDYNYQDTDYNYQDTDYNYQDTDYNYQDSDYNYQDSDTDMVSAYWDFDDRLMSHRNCQHMTQSSVDPLVVSNLEQRVGTVSHSVRNVCSLRNPSMSRIHFTDRRLPLSHGHFIHSSDVDIPEAVYEGSSLTYSRAFGQHHSPSSQRDIDPREITARMDSPIVKAVLNMEIPKPRVKEAIKTRLAENGEDFTSAEALLEAIFSSSSGGPGDVSDSVSDSKNEQDRRHPSESESQDSLKLMEENRLLKEQRQCKICMDEEVCVVFLPCGHLVCCSTCAPALNLCPICRAKIRGTVRTYIS